MAVVSLDWNALIAERDALRAEVAKLRAVVEAARLYVEDEPSAWRYDRLVAALAALDGKEG